MKFFCGFLILQKFQRPDVKSKESSKVMAQKCFKEWKEHWWALQGFFKGNLLIWMFDLRHIYSQ